MANHPNRGPKGPSSNPQPEEIKAARSAAGLTQTEAAALVHSTLSAWQRWEQGERRMPPGLWELFGIKTGLSLRADIKKEKAMENLLDTIIKENPGLAGETHRVHLAGIARGYRLMKRYGAGQGYDVPPPGPGFDEWIAGNSLFANACNAIRAAVGNDEPAITRRIVQLEGAS